MGCTSDGCPADGTTIVGIFITRCNVDGGICTCAGTVCKPPEI